MNRAGSREAGGGPFDSVSASFVRESNSVFGSRLPSAASSALKRLLIALGILGALVFAVEGGEYGSSDLWRQRSRQRMLLRAIDSLGREVDSLTLAKRGILTDPATQERVAREEFGMVRGSKEILYRFAEPADSIAP